MPPSRKIPHSSHVLCFYQHASTVPGDQLIHKLHHLLLRWERFQKRLEDNILQAKRKRLIITTTYLAGILEGAYLLYKKKLLLLIVFEELYILVIISSKQTLFVHLFK